MIPHSIADSMRYLCLLPLLAICSCGKKSPESASVTVNWNHSLSPADLDIRKQRFTAQPAKHQVAIFRSSVRNVLDPLERRVLDQIFFSNGEEVHVDLVQAPLSYYLGKQEFDGKDPETLFRDSWNIHAGAFRFVVKEYAFEGSSFDSGDSEAKGWMAFTKHTETRSKDLIFNFRMFIVSLEEAKKIHPELKTDHPPGTKKWEATHSYQGEIEELGMD